MLRPVQTAAPAATPVSLAEARAHLNVDFDDDDALITSLIDAAVAHLDGYAGILGRCLVSQEWRQDFTDWAWRFRLPFPDLSNIAVTYQDEANQTQAVSPALYELIEDERGALIVFRDSFEEPGLYDDAVARISVAFTAGYGDAEDVPGALTAAIRLLVGHWYANREAVNVGNITTELPMAVHALISPYRRAAV